jgi:hypothetical protein
MDGLALSCPAYLLLPLLMLLLLCAAASSCHHIEASLLS